ncbi:MAG TPA: c-type cytochrome [Gammaproteobacteria bacterium]|nr:c-type cytochrome [Gammaproteobacteria bacterium]
MSHQDDVFISTFKGILIVLAGLAVVFVLVAHYLEGRFDTANTGQSRAAQAQLLARIAPLGQVHVAGEPAPSAAAPAAAKAKIMTGEEVYHTVCSACHATGVMGAPKFGNKVLWAPHVAKGMDVLFQHALHGFKLMPPKGGSNLPDQDIKNAVEYMVSHSK